MQDEYFSKSLGEREKDELRLLDELVVAEVIAERKKQEYIARIRAKNNKLRQDEKDRADKEKGKKIDNPLGNATGISSDFVDMFRMLESLQAKIKDGEQSWEDYAAVAVSSLAFVNTALPSVAQLFSAQQQEEENAVTRRYDMEIKKAGENSRKGKKLEEQKQKELAKVKNKYRKKQMAMEIAQATAGNTAAAALTPEVRLVDTSSHESREAIERLNENLESKIMLWRIPFGRELKKAAACRSKRLL